MKLVLCDISAVWRVHLVLDKHKSDKYNRIRINFSNVS